MTIFYRATRHALQPLVLLIFSGLLMACTTGTASLEQSEVVVEEVVPLEPEDIAFHTHNAVRDYTDRLVHDLMNNLMVDEWDSPLVIVSFKFFGEDKRGTERFKKLISESLIGHIQVYGIPLKADYLADKPPLSAKYILTGVIVENERGFVVNARIVHVKSQQILSHASTLIPAFVPGTI